MRWLKKVAGIGLVALLLGAGLVLVPGGSHPGAAYADGSMAIDPSGSGGVDPIAGDPDGPTGDFRPPKTVTANPTETAIGPPAKRLGAWAHWKLALKLFVQFAFSR